MDGPIGPGFGRCWIALALLLLAIVDAGGSIIFLGGERFTVLRTAGWAHHSNYVQ